MRRGTAFLCRGCDDGRWWARWRAAFRGLVPVLIACLPLPGQAQDTLRPTLSASSPPHGAKGVDPATPVRFVFSEPMKPQQHIQWISGPVRVSARTRWPTPGAGMVGSWWRVRWEVGLRTRRSPQLLSDPACPLFPACRRPPRASRISRQPAHWAGWDLRPPSGTSPGPGDKHLRPGDLEPPAYHASDGILGGLPPDQCATADPVGSGGGAKPFHRGCRPQSGDRVGDVGGTGNARGRQLGVDPPLRAVFANGRVRHRRSLGGVSCRPLSIRRDRRSRRRVPAQGEW